jgi:hypothetical protein
MSDKRVTVDRWHRLRRSIATVKHVHCYAAQFLLSIHRRRPRYPDEVFIPNLAPVFVCYFPRDISIPSPFRGRASGRRIQRPRPGHFAG